MKTDVNCRSILINLRNFVYKWHNQGSKRQSTVKKIGRSVEINGLSGKRKGSGAT